MSRILLVSFLLLPLGSGLRAQLSLQTQLGLTSGSPIGPIPEGASGQPGVRLDLGLGFEYRFAERLGLRLGLHHHSKAASYMAPISGSQQAGAAVFGVVIRLPFAFSYTGTVRGRFANHYWQLPLSLVYYNESPWRPFAGFYLAKTRRAYHKGRVDVAVSGGLLEIRDQSFDESASIRAWDWGAVVGTDFAFSSWGGMRVQVEYGMISIFEINPEGLAGAFRNLYVKAGFYFSIAAPFKR